MACLLLLVVAPQIVACDTAVEEEQAFQDAAFLAPSGFTATSDRGDVLSDDPDDWRISPAYFERLVIDPAFPNPASAGTNVALPIRVRISDTVQGGLELVSYDSNRIPRLLDRVADARSPGAYVLRFMPQVLGVTGLVRIYVLDNAGGLISYGDIMIES
ncbi:MAG: hypothetical protein OXM02_06280 [Bacteroidota bacterium]|nr:hypothetical protein [Bacteroidota bacterium]